MESLPHNAPSHTPMVEELALETALEWADHNSESTDSNADPPKIGVWIQTFRDRLIIRGWGLHNGKIAGPKLFERSSAIYCLSSA